MRSIAYNQSGTLCISSISQGIAYHQNEVLYIIKPTEIHTSCDDIPSLLAWIKKHSFKRTSVFWRHHPESNWGMKVLQTSALPLGYGAVLN